MKTTDRLQPDYGFSRYSVDSRRHTGATALRNSGLNGSTEFSDELAVLTHAYDLDELTLLGQYHTYGVGSEAS